MIYWGGSIGINSLIIIHESPHVRDLIIHPASRGVAAHTAGLFRSVRGAKGGVEYEEQSSTGELTYITAGFVNIFLSGLKICFLPHELDMSAGSKPSFCVVNFYSFALRWTENMFFVPLPS